MRPELDHVGIAVRSLAERLPFWTGVLGLPLAGRERVEGEGVEVAFLDAAGTRIELLEPLGEDSPVARFLARTGEGIHHLTLGVADLEAAIARAREGGVEVIGGASRIGASGKAVAFLHPRACGGVLLELVESRPPSEMERFGNGEAVLAYLREPQEKLWGLLRGLDSAGVRIDAIDLTSFDEWAAQVERGDETVVGPSLLFLPMQRVEKLMLDRSSGGFPSLAERFRARTGRTVEEALRASR